MRRAACCFLITAPLSLVAQTRRPVAPTTIGAIRCGAPAVAQSAPSNAPTLNWRGARVRWTEWPVQLGDDRVRNRIIVVAVDPKRVSLSLEINRQGDGLGPWTINDAPADALIALNAGQFTDSGPWGWVRHDGREQQAPGSGSLAGALVVDTTGRIALLTAAEIQSARHDSRWREAVQSYPQLLSHSTPDAALCGGESLDLTHRDTRLVVALHRDGRLLIIMSRYAGTGSGLAKMAERVPIGPTTPEMAEIAKRLGATDALMLDGGLSAQLMIRDASVTTRWPGLRTVPLALVIRARR